MSKDREVTPNHLAKAEKQRLTAQEGARAMSDVTKNAIAVRANMARLRELRLAQEAEQAAATPPAEPKAKKAAKAAKAKSETAGFFPSPTAATQSLRSGEREEKNNLSSPRTSSA